MTALRSNQTRFIFGRAHMVLAILSLLLLCTSVNAQTKPPLVVVSIKPLHSIISHITDGVNQTLLLLTQQQSPHDFQLRPSQKRLINAADIFFYSSDNIESFVPALKATNKSLHFIELSRIPELHALPARTFHMHETHEDKHESIGANAIPNIDGHIWLSIDNAIIIANKVADVLTLRIPEYAKHYQHNLTILTKKLLKLKQQNQQLLSKFQTTPYLVYHDAYQYFEQENQLNNAHFITTNPEHAPGIKRIKTLRELIRVKNIQCIFYEPPNIPALLNTLTEDAQIKLAPLDPIGAQIPEGKTQYFQLMQQTATTLKECLSK